VNVLAFLFSAVLVPMLVGEFTDWVPWLAARLIKAATRTLPSSVRPRYAEEWLAELDAVPGKLAKLALAVHIFVRAPATSAAINGLPSSRAMTVKALFDKAAAAVALILLSPLFAAVAVAIRLGDNGPALFTQTRVGKDGHPFKIYKFRTMVVDAEQRLAELRASNDLDGVLFKMRRDPRVTAIGARLRKWPVDELPQLINVFRGEMSLVGPRPALPEEAARYADHVRRRLVVKPGLTGMWQVNGRSDLSWDESVRLDLRYVENWSFALDLQILWRTLSRSRGAHRGTAHLTNQRSKDRG
jgi:lipopolysaccharide/colanic/teichoic acid biosynthesis glycosyltransferase